MKVDIMGTYVPAIGIPWFLIVLFLGRSLFDYLHLKFNSKQFIAAIIICTLSGLVFGKLQWLPFSFDIALAIMPFFYFGNYLKNVDIKHKTLPYGGISLAVWAITLLIGYITTHTYMELACRRYTLFPLCYVTAIAGTMFVSYFSTMVEPLKMIKPLKYLGKNSMYMLWVHIMDYTVRFIWNATSNSFINAIIRMTVDVVLFVILMHVLSSCHSAKTR